MSTSMLMGAQQFADLIAETRAEVHPNWPFVGTHYMPLRHRLLLGHGDFGLMGPWVPGVPLAEAIAKAKARAA